ncbi:MAG: alpha/beta hydrolase [Pseudomonadota bacterium]
MAFQSTLIKMLLKLPQGLLIKLAGGQPTQIGGRTLDPYLQFISFGASKQPPLSSFEPAISRARAANALAMLAASPDPSISSEDFAIAAPGRQIPVRLYRPSVQTPDHPMMVYMHMGGGVIGDLETCDAFCALLAAKLGTPILSVDYRLAPEHQFPKGLDDCIFAYEWALKKAESYGAPAGQAAIGGDSMGGNFTAVIAQEMRRQHKPLPSLQLMLYPATNLVTPFPSATLYGDTYPLSTEIMEWFMGHYLPEGQDPSDLRLSPALESRVEQLPPAIIVTAGFDPLVDDGAAYAKHLEAAGVPVTYKCFDSLAHGFTAFMAVSPVAKAACHEVADMVAKAYATLDTGIVA